MTQFSFMLFLAVLWLVPVALATVFYIQKRKSQKRLDAIKQIIDETEKELKELESSKRRSSYLRERKEDGTIVYQNL